MDDPNSGDTTQLLALRELALLEFGGTFLRSLEPLTNLREVEERVVLQEWTLGDDHFAITRGCAFYSDKRSAYRDEYTASMGGAGHFDLLNMVAFFHITRRTLNYSDVLEVGRSFFPAVRYSHVLITVPFYLPPTVNSIAGERVNLELKHVLPIFPFEATFIDERGVEEFESRILRSYGVLSSQRNADYLK